jgi:hypothetical protein
MIFKVFFAFGYKVRYVQKYYRRGHIVDDVDDEGEDKIAARLEQLEPMEVVFNYGRFS